MRKHKAVHAALALALLAVMAVSLCPAALAAGAGQSAQATPTPVPTPVPLNDLRVYGNVFEAGQYYAEGQGSSTVYTVQIAATNVLDNAEDLRDQMLAAGFDCFVYLYNGNYRVMCGKFLEDYDASCYSESIHGYSAMNQAYVTSAILPEENVKAFADAFYPHVTISQDRSVMQTYWEKPTGAFFREEGPNNAYVFSIQCSAGSSFQGAEANRDAMIAMGYPAYVFKCDLHYKNMVGAFATLNDAYAFLATFQAATGLTNAIVVGVSIPAAEVAKLHI